MQLANQWRRMQALSEETPGISMQSQSAAAPPAAGSGFGQTRFGHLKTDGTPFLTLTGRPAEASPAKNPQLYHHLASTDLRQATLQSFTVNLLIPPIAFVRRADRGTRTLRYQKQTPNSAAQRSTAIHPCSREHDDRDKIAE